ncbi:MAG: hypothetical protein HY660_04985 [Armatimonadetes bacterium]|nr:hypothetical protein [Armatimonadota bacterium]
MVRHTPAGDEIEHDAKLSHCARFLQFGKMDAKLVDSALNPMGLDKNDPSADDDIITVTDMHVPVGQSVIVRVSSRDVIHSFGVPNLRIKMDAIPGMEVPQWFTAKTPGQ